MNAHDLIDGGSDTDEVSLWPGDEGWLDFFDGIVSHTGARRDIPDELTAKRFLRAHVLAKSMPGGTPRNSKCYLLLVPRKKRYGLQRQMAVVQEWCPHEM